MSMANICIDDYVVKDITRDPVSYPSDVAELNKKALEEFQNKPLGFICPPGFTGKNDDQGNFVPVVDPIQCFKSETDIFLEDLELIGISIIGCVPGAGPILQGICTIFLNKFKPKPISAADVHKRLNEKLPQLKKELLEVLESKIEKSELATYKDMCEKGFQSLTAGGMELLFDDLLILKKKLKKNIIPDPDDSFLSGLRGKFDKFRVDIKAMMPMFSNYKYLEHVYERYIEIMFIYIMMMYQLVYNWYTYGFDPKLARGTPKTANYKETHGYRYKIHINTQKCLINLQNCLNTNRSGMKNLKQMLIFDPVLYPLPFIKNETPIFVENPKLSIDSSKKKSFILRIDGGYILMDQEREKPDSFDSITGCKGIFFNGEPIKFSVGLSDPKFVRVRCFISGDSSLNLKPTVSINGNKKEYDGDFIESGSFKCQKSPENIRTGFYHWNKLPEKIKDMEIEIDCPSPSKDNLNRLLFFEVIATQN
ncbi:hypothetical protein ACTA71_008362 [Dictyostelium dimigraforme]